MDEDVLIPMLVAWIIFALLVAWVADKRGRSFNGWLDVGLLLSPLLALILVAVLGQSTEGSAFHSCPFCAERIKSAATVCRFCGRDLPQPQPLPPPPLVR